MSDPTQPVDPDESVERDALAAEASVEPVDAEEHVEPVEAGADAEPLEPVEPGADADPVALDRDDLGSETGATALGSDDLEPEPGATAVDPDDLEREPGATAIDSDALERESGTTAGDTDDLAVEPGATALDPDDLTVEPPATTASGAATASAAEAVTRSHPTGRRRPVGSTAVKRMRRSAAADRRRRAVVGAVNRTIGTIAGLGIIGASVWALGWMPLPSIGVEPEASVIRPAAGDQVRVCPGPLMQMGLTTTAGEASAVGSPELETFGSAAVVTRDLGETPGPTVLTVAADGAETVTASGAQSLSVETERTRGFTATACIQPAPTQWLMAGATTLGHTLVLDVSNPGAAPARVNFAMFAETGPVAPGIPEMVLEPGQRQQVSLAGIAPDAEAIAVQLTATGSPVAAFLHETITATLDPVGFEIAPPTALPATTQVLPGVHIAERAGHDHGDQVGPHEPEAGELADRGTIVRLLNPGEAPTPLDLRVFDEAGAVVEHYAFDLPSHVVADIVLSGLPTGAYTVRVDADSPVLAAARVGPVEPAEFAWLAAPAPLGEREAVTVPTGGSPRLAIANPGDEPATVRVDGREVPIAAGATVSLEASAGVIDLEGAAGLVAALHWDAPGGFASVPALTGNADSEPVTVYP